MVMATEPTLDNVQLRSSKNWKRENVVSGQSMEVLSGFTPLLFVTELVGLLAVILILTWIICYNKGLSLASPDTEFNWHIFFMSLGMIYLMGNALLTFRILRHMPKKRLKLLHASLHGAVFILVLLAVIAAFDMHNKMGYRNLYSVHSWIGLLTVILFVVQAVVGFTGFLFPGYSNSLRSLTLPYHVFFGNVIFGMGIVTAVSGINEKAIFVLGAKYSDMAPSALLLNMAGVLFVIFGILVLYLTTNFKYKRDSRPADDPVAN